MGHKNGNSKDGISKLMMTYDPQDWAEMQQEFEKAIPNLTITKDALIQAELEQAKAQLRNAPTIEQVQAQLKKAEEVIMSRQEQFENYMKEILDVRQKQASPFLVYNQDKDVKQFVQGYVQNEEEKIKQKLRDDYHVPS